MLYDPEVDIHWPMMSDSSERHKIDKLVLNIMSVGNHDIFFLLALQYINE